MSGINPWGITLVTKEVEIPFTGTTIPNPNGAAYFIPQGGNWSATPISLNYLFTGDSICDIELQASSAYTTVPFLITGYTKSTISDLRVYGKKTQLYAGKYKLNVQVTGDSGSVGTVYGPSLNNDSTGYTINGINYFDFNDGTTIFVTESSGLTTDWLVCTALTKEEVYINVVEQAQIQSQVFVDRGKNSGLEVLERLGEVDNVGDIEKYGYGFFKVINSTP